MKIVAISTSCFTETNREFYRRLDSESSIKVCLIIPKQWDFGKGLVEADPALATDPEIIFLEATSYHHRLYKLEGLAKTVKQAKPDVIYYEGDPGSRMSAILGPLSKKIGSNFFALSCENLSQNPMAVTKREGKSQLINSSIKYALIQYSKKFIDTLFVINNEGLAYFKKLGFKKVVKTPLGFNENIFNIDASKRSRIRKKLNIEEDTVVIAYFGRLVYEKGVHLLIEALNKLKAKNWVFLIDEFGRYKTNYQAEIEKRIKDSNFNDKTIFFEADHTEIASFMNASDITVLPSIPTKKWVEQYGRVVPEAMACGNLLIVSNIGAQKDFLQQDYEFTYTPSDVQKLSQQLSKAIEFIEDAQYEKEHLAQRAKMLFGLDQQVALFKAQLGVN